MKNPFRWLFLTKSKATTPARIEFDAAGQSGKRRGGYAATPYTDATVYDYWVRRARLSEKDWTYWLVGEDGLILTAPLTEEGMRAAVAVRERLLPERV